LDSEDGKKTGLYQPQLQEACHSSFQPGASLGRAVGRDGVALGELDGQPEFLANTVDWGQTRPAHSSPATTISWGNSLLAATNLSFKPNPS
jgi:hypothetical protein